MTGDETQSGLRYVAFISYSHADHQAARWLHQAVESYRVPRRLRTALRQTGSSRDRLAPVFLDHDELSSSPDLGETVRAALATSRFLIVLCSPAAARSHWVNEEIRAFKALGGEDRILCVLAAGEPGAAARGLAPELECFPPALQYRVIDGVVSAERAAEPLASDLRSGHRARRDVRLKVVAALLGVPFDVLRQREQVRRQRRLVLLAGASTVSCVVLAGLTLTAWLARNQAERQREIAQQKSLTAERTSDFLVSLFKVSDPSEARGSSITAREILDRGVRQIDESLQDEPAVRAELLVTLGEVYTGLGLFGNAGELLSKAYGTAEQTPEAAMRQAVALAELEFQRGDYERSDAYLAAAEEARSRDATATPELQAQILLGRGEVAAVQERDADAQRYFTAALAVMGEGALDHEIGVRASEGLALASYYAGDLENAQRQYQQALNARTALSGETHPKVPDSLNVLGGIAYAQGDSKLAEEYYQRSLAVDTRVLGPKHPNLAATMLSLGRLRLERREFAAAAEVLAEAVDLIRAQSSDTQPDLVFGYSNLALAHIGADELERAAPLLESALTAAVANDHPLQGPILVYQAELACRTGSAEHGLQVLDTAAPLVTEFYPDEPWRSALLRSVQAECLGVSGHEAAAVPLLEESTPVVLARWPADTAFGRAAIDRAIRFYTRSGDSARLARYRDLGDAAESAAQ